MFWSLGWQPSFPIVLATETNPLGILLITDRPSPLTYFRGCLFAPESWCVPLSPANIYGRWCPSLLDSEAIQKAVAVHETKINNGYHSPVRFPLHYLSKTCASLLPYAQFDEHGTAKMSQKLTLILISISHFFRCQQWVAHIPLILTYPMP